MNHFITALIAAGALSAPHGSLDWNSDYGVALEETRDSAKPLLVLIDKPEDPAEGSQEPVLRPDSGLSEVLSEYTLCYVDANTEYGQRVAEVFKTQSYPFTAVIDRQGKKIVEKWTGTLDAQQWNEALEDPDQPNANPFILRYFSTGRAPTRACYT